MEEFREIIIKELEKRLGEEYQIIPQDRCKNNGLNLHGICIHRKSEDISPIVYLEEFILPYVAGLLSLEKIIDLVLEKCDMKEIPPNLVSHLKEFDMIKDKVGISVINYDGSVRTYVDEDLKQEIALKLLEEIPNFPLKEAERAAREEMNDI